MSADLASILLALHDGPGFVIPNAWDAGSARILAQAGFPAIATTSAGIAWSYGVPDGGGVGAERMLERVAEIVEAVDVPVSADLEDGYGSTPEEVAAMIGRALQAGVVGRTSRMRPTGACSMSTWPPRRSRRHGIRHRGVPS